MLVQNQNDLELANKIYREIPITFDCAGHNAECAKAKRKEISKYFANRYVNKLYRKSIYGKIKECRRADRLATIEARTPIWNP